MKLHSKVRDWYMEWKEIQGKGEGTLTIEECPYGLASNFTIQCNCCKQTECVMEARKPIFTKKH
jgi:hypothetical protein